MGGWGKGGNLYDTRSQKCTQIIGISLEKKKEATECLPFDYEVGC